MLEGKVESTTQVNPANPEKLKMSPAQKVQKLLKKRDDKLKFKEEQSKRKQNPLDEEEKQIMKKVKSKKNETKRKRARETDEFDDLLAKYKTKVLKKIDKSSKIGKGHDFEEIEMSDY